MTYGDGELINWDGPQHKFRVEDDLKITGNLKMLFIGMTSPERNSLANLLF